MSENGKTEGQNRIVPIHIDDQLLSECARGDRRGQSRLYRITYSMIMSVCIRYTNSRDEAEDLVNMSFLKILNNIGSRKENVPFEAWARRITINTVIDQFRKNKRSVSFTEVENLEEKADEMDEGVVNSYLERMKAEHLQSLIDRLPEASRKVFNLYAVDGYSHKEIAEMLGISIGTSKWHVNSARTKLKELLATVLPEIKSLAS